MVATLKDYTSAEGLYLRVVSCEFLLTDWAFPFEFAISIFVVERHSPQRDVVQPVSQSVISRSRPALTPPPARSPAPPLPVGHKYRVLAPGGYSIVASEVSLSQRTGCSLPLFALYC